MRTLVTGDIHGGLRALQQVLERANVTADDKLIFLGDYVDGWSESPQVLDFLISLNKTNNCIFIRGNHDDLLCNWLNESRENLMWYNHGGEATVNAYRETTAESKAQHIHFLSSLQDYHLDQQNRLYVHAGFTNMHGVHLEHFPRLLFWDRTLWETAVALDPAMQKDDVKYPKRFTIYDEVYIGHTPVTKVGMTVPVNMANIWNVDTGASFKGPLTTIDADTKEFWQSDPLPDLYPDERGRN
jgi:serine/threonine protein phosphatase 1